MAIGAKEVFSHLMWVLLGPGDTALVPSPSYPIHIWGPILAGAGVHYVRLGPDQDFFANLHAAWEQAWPRPRVVVMSFPHNPTGECVDLAFMARMVEFAREHDVLLVHDFAYAELGFDGYKPPSLLEVPGAKDVAVEIYSLTKSFSMAGWRVGFMLGNPEVVAALARLKSYLDYGTFQPIQIASIVAMNEAPNYPLEVNEIYLGRRDTLVDGLARIGWEIEKPRGTMFVWAPVPEPYEEMGSLEFAKMLVKRRRCPRGGLRSGGEGFVRFALSRRAADRPALRGIRKAPTKLARISAASPSVRRQLRDGADDRSTGSSRRRLGRQPPVTPTTASASTSGSWSAMRPSTIPSLMWRTASAIATSSLCRTTGANRSSVAANWKRLNELRCSWNHAIDARIPSSMRATGSGSSPIAACWRRRRSWWALRRISTNSSSLLGKYQ